VVVTVAKGYDLGYIWKTQGEVAAGRTTGGYYLNAAQAGEHPGRWWGSGVQALGLTPGQIVQRKEGTFLVMRDGNIERRRPKERDPTIVVFDQYAFDLTRLAPAPRPPALARAILGNVHNIVNN